MRNTFINTLVKLAEKDKRIFLISPDLGFSVLEEYEKRFPDRFFNVGIAEANAIGIASGLALSGKIVYVYSIIPFVTMRPFEQIRIDVAYMNTNVRLIGVGAGLTYGAAGATHHSIEDISIMRSLPNMTVFSPCDSWEFEQGILQSVTHKGPIYFRLGKHGEPVISDKESQFCFGKANTIKDGNDIHILFTGNVSDIVQELCERLLLINISVSLLSIHTLKPFDDNIMEEILETGKPIFTVEEHSIIGGLGSVVSEFIAEKASNCIFKRFALPDCYSHFVGSQAHIRNCLGLSVNNIYTEIVRLCS